MKHYFFILLLLCGTHLQAWAERSPKDPVELPQEESVEAVAETSSGDVLQGLLEQIEGIKKSLKGSLPEEKKAEQEAILERLEKEFDELLAGKESVAYFQADPEAKTIQEELLEIFDPLIGEVKSATASSREKEELRNQIELLTLKKTAIESALERISKIKKSEENVSASLESMVLKEEKQWLGRQERTSLELDSAKLQLTEIEKGNENAVESASKVITKFFKSRGLHLLLATGMAVLVFLLIKFGYKFFTKYSPTHHNDEFYSTSKTLDGAIHLSSFIFSVLSFILILFLCDDWVLLTACLLLIMGAAWAVKDKIADIMEEVRLILNIGSIREGERLNFQGIPWQVKKIRLYSSLENPELEGGKLRIPVNQLVGLHSRACNASERYFPTSLNDWVILSDGTFGKVVHQNPDFVEMVLLGGAHKLYKTDAFLDLTPENLSETSFRITSVFGVDYKHQETVTEEIPTTLQKVIHDGVLEYLEDSKSLKRLKVEFSAAAASSLDFAILADFSSTVAPKYNELTRLIQRLSVDACNEHGWEIPFTQITVHQAD